MHERSLGNIAKRGYFIKFITIWKKIYNFMKKGLTKSRPYGMIKVRKGSTMQFWQKLLNLTKNKC